MNTTAKKSSSERFSHLRKVSITFPRPAREDAPAFNDLIEKARALLVSRFGVAPDVISYRAGPEFNVFPVIRENVADDVAKVLFFRALYPMYQVLAAVTKPAATEPELLPLNIYKVTARQPLTYSDEQGPAYAISDTEVLAENEADALEEAKTILFCNEKTNFLVAKVNHKPV